MKLSSAIFDNRIMAYNVLVDMSIAEYELLVKGILENNIFQRRRIGSSKTVYSLLKQDIQTGCVIPPIVLALPINSAGHDPDHPNETVSKIQLNAEKLLILDGLQRTYTILDLLAEMRRDSSLVDLAKVEAAQIRVEIYVGLNRLGILYRMLTLNTGQTPMSLRQQIEILYLDYLDSSVSGVELVRETDSKPASRFNQYNFKDVIEGFNAYLDRDELPLDKANVLENINSLEKLSRENQSTQIFERYVEVLHSFLIKVTDDCDGAELSSEYLEDNPNPFGKTAVQIFKKPQAMSGLGAAIGKLVDFEVISSIDNAAELIPKLHLEDAEEFIELMNECLLWLRNNSKKIGNAQRTFFSFYFRDLLNKDSDSFADLPAAARSALHKYQSQNS